VFHWTASITQDGSTFGCGVEERILLKYFYTQKVMNIHTPAKFSNFYEAGQEIEKNLRLHCHRL
jgi:hypothetical protein